MSRLEISSPKNPRIKHLVKLRKRNVRDEENLFLIEGYRECVRALASQWPFEELFVCPDLFLGENEEALISEAETRGTRIYVCSEEVFRKVAYRDRPDGLLAVAPQAHLSFDDLQSLENPFFLVLVGIEKPGNLGTMLRTADGAGVDAVILSDKVTDIYNPNTVRASVGTLFSVPVIESPPEECWAWLEEQGIPLLAMTPHASRSLYETSLEGPIAVTMGSEMLGLNEAWLNRAEIKCFLPMGGIADSLNVSTAASITLYEVLRQRQQP